jgi:spermidine/putrescine transport system ATP-binding protein
MSEFAVELRNVVKCFPNPGGGEVTAVDDVTVQIRNGEFFSLLGPSGCGKTTSLRMIGGFELPTSGDIIVMDQSMGRTPPYLRPVNTVFQSYALFQHMTVAQNVAFGLEMEHLPRHKINQRVEEALEMVQLHGLGGRRPRQLSGGQQQRVALARALIKRPAVLLLDEPLGALDLKLRKEMQLELKSLQNRVGITFIYVTHDQEEALTMSDRIAVMSKGKVLQMGRPVEIYERPNCRFVADFIGETNFLSGRVQEVMGDQAAVLLDQLQIPVMGACQGSLAVGERAVISIRPEKMRLSDTCVPEQNCFKVAVANIAYVGSDTRVDVDMGDGHILRVWEQNSVSTLNPHAIFPPGQQIYVILPPHNTLILPEDNTLPASDLTAAEPEVEVR